MIVFQVFFKSSERNTENTMSHLYFNKESGYSEENKCENEVFDSTILHHRKKLNIFMSKLPIYCIQYYHRKSRLMQMPETANGSALEKKRRSLKFRKIQRKTTGLRLSTTLLKKRLWHRCFAVNFIKFLTTPFLLNNSGRLLLKWGHFKNEAREIYCLCCRELDAMLIASAKIPEREGSMLVPSFFLHLPDY